jgi:hypothetical protein
MVAVETPQAATATALLPAGNKILFTLIVIGKHKQSTYA